MRKSAHLGIHDGETTDKVELPALTPAEADRIVLCLDNFISAVDSTAEQNGDNCAQRGFPGTRKSKQDTGVRN
jgi:hypothetical protein